jgi:hypothetical protein
MLTRAAPKITHVMTENNVKPNITPKAPRPTITKMIAEANFPTAETTVVIDKILVLRLEITTARRRVARLEEEIRRIATRTRLNSISRILTIQK